MKKEPDDGFLFALIDYLPVDEIMAFRAECRSQCKKESRLFETEIVLLGSKVKVEMTFDARLMAYK